MSDKKTIIVTQTKSPIGRKSYQRQTLIGLGLNKTLLISKPSLLIRNNQMLNFIYHSSY